MTIPVGRHRPSPCPSILHVGTELTRQFGETLRKAIAGISNVDTVIPGHNPTPVTWNDFVNFSGFYNDVVMKTQQGKAAGRSVDDIVGSYRVPSQYSDFSAPENRLRSTVQYVFDGQ